MRRRQVVATIPFVSHARFNEKALIVITCYRMFSSQQAVLTQTGLRFVREVVRTKNRKFSLSPLMCIAHQEQRTSPATK